MTFYLSLFSRRSQSELVYSLMLKIFWGALQLMQGNGRTRAVPEAERLSRREAVSIHLLHKCALVSNQYSNKIYEGLRYRCERVKKKGKQLAQDLNGL